MLARGWPWAQLLGYSTLSGGLLVAVGAVEVNTELPLVSSCQAHLQHLGTHQLLVEQWEPVVLGGIETHGNVCVLPGDPHSASSNLHFEAHFKGFSPIAFLLYQAFHHICLNSHKHHSWKGSPACEQLCLQDTSESFSSSYSTLRALLGEIVCILEMPFCRVRKTLGLNAGVWAALPSRKFVPKAQVQHQEEAPKLQPL